MWYTHTLDYYSAERKNEIPPFATIWMNLEHIMLSVLIFNIVDEYTIVYFIFFVIYPYVYYELKQCKKHCLVEKAYS